MITAINKPHRLLSGSTPDAVPAAAARWAGTDLGIILSVDGMVLTVLAIITAPLRAEQLVQILLGLAVAIPGVVIA